MAGWWFEVIGLRWVVNLREEAWDDGGLVQNLSCENGLKNSLKLSCC